MSGLGAGHPCGGTGKLWLQRQSSPDSARRQQINATALPSCGDQSGTHCLWVRGAFPGRRTAVAKSVEGRLPRGLSFILYFSPTPPTPLSGIPSHVS